MKLKKIIPFLIFLNLIVGVLLFCKFFNDDYGYLMMLALITLPVTVMIAFVYVGFYFVTVKKKSTSKRTVVVFYLLLPYLILSVLFCSPIDKDCAIGLFDFCAVHKIESRR
jgi:hypothetical protein